MAQHSLGRKLLLKSDSRLLLINAPPEYRTALLTFVAEDQIATIPADNDAFSVIHLFARQRTDLAQVPELIRAMTPGGVFWISWPKKSSGLRSDLDRERLVREVQAFGIGPTTAISIDEVWSALRFKMLEQNSPEPAIELFVNGTLMRGLALSANLAGAEFLGEFRTAPSYRLFSIDDRHPGMFEVAKGGIAIAGELYRVPPEVVRRVEAGEPPNLYRGQIQLENGRTVDGILYPRDLAEGHHREITAFGDWRAYLASRRSETTGSDRQK